MTIENEASSGVDSPKSAKETASSKLTTNEAIDGTPFRVVSIEGKWFLAVGQHRITDFMNSEDDLYRWMESNHWDAIVQLIAVVATAIVKEQIESQNKN